MNIINSRIYLNYWSYECFPNIISFPVFYDFILIFELWVIETNILLENEFVYHGYCYLLMLDLSSLIKYYFLTRLAMFSEKSQYHLHIPMLIVDWNMRRINN